MELHRLEDSAVRIVDAWQMPKALPFLGELPMLGPTDPLFRPKGESRVSGIALVSAMVNLELGVRCHSLKGLSAGFRCARCIYIYIYLYIDYNFA